VYLVGFIIRMPIEYECGRVTFSGAASSRIHVPALTSTLEIFVLSSKFYHFPS